MDSYMKNIRTLITDDSENTLKSSLLIYTEKGGLRTKGYLKPSTSGKPLISVITIVYNGEKYLEETIQSVLNQTHDNIEYIIIDGGSTDGTVNIIKKYEDRMSY
jgi:cellulose synthase/poly-beta-1,6-N-acetylglucosamine synthase-like glycosyltransferase